MLPLLTRYTLNGIGVPLIMMFPEGLRRQGFVVLNPAGAGGREHGAAWVGTPFTVWSPRSALIAGGLVNVKPCSAESPPPVPPVGRVARTGKTLLRLSRARSHW